MEPDPGGTEPSREVRLEGAVLVLAGGIVLAALTGAFYLGRWVERRSAPPPGRAAAARGEHEAGLESASEDATFFDTLGGGEKAAEPRREAAKPASPPGDEPESASQPMTGGPWVVQVFAGRDKVAADVLVRGLKEKGHPVHLDTRREGSGSLYRVQVGGFPTREAADAAADRLRKDGVSGAWVTKAR
jgi:hypothetical protein